MQNADYIKVPFSASSLGPRNGAAAWSKCAPLSSAAGAPRFCASLMAALGRARHSRSEAQPLTVQPWASNARASRLQSCRFHCVCPLGAAARDIVAAALHVITGSMELTGARTFTTNPSIGHSLHPTITL